jgi:creatinine amidohydrolase
MDSPRSGRTERTIGGAPRLTSRTWQEAGGILVVPLGSTEQHGPHLPLDVDTRVALAVADELVRRWRASGRDASVGPAIAVGASGEHQGFAGTVSIGTDALRTVIVEIGRSASVWAERLVFVNGHGGNVDAVSSAVGILRGEGRAAMWVPCEIPGSDAHAGRTETSLMLHLDAGAVRVERAERGEVRPLAAILPALRESGVAAVSPNGVLGDPAGANAGEGAALLESMCDLAWQRAIVEAR